MSQLVQLEGKHTVQTAHCEAVWAVQPVQCWQLIARCYLHIWWYFSCKNWARKTDAPTKIHRKHNSRIIALYALDFLLTAALVGVSENLQPFWGKYASMLRKIILLVKLSQDCQQYLPSQDKRKSYEEKNHHWLLRKSMCSASPASQNWVRGHDPYLYSFCWICSSTSKYYLTEKLKNRNVCAKPPWPHTNRWYLCLKRFFQYHIEYV